MKWMKVVALLLFTSQFCFAQTVTEKLSAALKLLQLNPTAKHASISLYVLNSKTNEVVFDYNSQVGLAPASCQKIVTSVASFELLGKDYQYKTELGYDGKLKNGILDGNLYLTGYGDPTLGSWRYASTKEAVVLRKWIEAIQKAGIKSIKGSIMLNSSAFSLQPIPGGWPWEDIGNYYGAGSWGLNWYENQYDLTLKAGTKEGGATTIMDTKPELEIAGMINTVKTGKPGSGDNANIYLPPYSLTGFITGTVAPNKNSTIAGAIPNPLYQIQNIFSKSLKEANIGYKDITNSFEYAANKKTVAKPDIVFYTYLSPGLDSITYWFLRKSINLYGECILKTLAYNQTGEGTTEAGVSLVKQFWQDRGIEKSALKVLDGSGLSPQNRITTNALVNILQYARDKPWYSAFYNALPIYNGMKIKSGTIGGTKGFAGYHTSKAGIDYTVAMIINDFDGPSSEMVKKMFLVLDELK
ncbi:D-alanyl-D-alanine carboxypeptidase/D-alanyl-D-alanine-endopeptidase [Parasediminibacterium sp. JCM 36343]|uniref:D-alanyl-D-alanine carboxypeptidase/D-alanyl-D-alanine endopeptidase n=1 Tax=Parasediminibacterium sp. JCM 36343 TaxID=3374279 RepID=UPI00397914B0